MPAVAIGTHLTATFDTEDSGLTMGLDIVTLGLAILALVTHAGILFAGSSAHEAKAFVVYTYKHRGFQRNIRVETKLLENRRQAVRSAFTNYMDRLGTHNKSYPTHRVDPGPFDVVARNLINEIFGYEIIQLPTRRENGQTRP